MTNYYSVLFGLFIGFVSLGASEIYNPAPVSEVFQNHKHSALNPEKQNRIPADCHIFASKPFCVISIGKPLCSIKISKSANTLSVYRGSQLIKSYPVVFGFNPKDDKLREGDGCTPEGKFKVKAMYPHAKWSKFLWIDYPNAESVKKHEQAEKKGVIPANSPIGGSIGIHGVPAGLNILIDLHQNWTLGCISLKNRDVDELYQFAYPGMLVEIIK